ncbi:ADAMTS-like protein 2 isoform X2 [Denticeps clupeoides]|uniref:ADAMTS-like protein 2 isoform X2 n=1 Tax=Denticeps clupeoides TaxID=299321 RepID=UPI0010A3CA16|nr:ADAMTS-like protein 2 isoform X2 [Denticeps clupeoides]
MYSFRIARFGHAALPHWLLFLWMCHSSSGVSFKDSREDSSVPQPDEVAQWWGEWSSWTTCSRTCGGGVRSQERHCLQQRRTTTQVSTSLCSGSSKQYQLCRNQPCSKSRISFKQHQCSQFNGKAFGRRHYVWVPLYPDDYISISNKPCDLQCTTTTGERQLLVPAHDGTYCRDGIFQGVCIEGQCQRVGCDGQLYSRKIIDKCGMCGGNGSSCYRVSGSYRKGITQLGYLFITNIPSGATDIQIIERRKTENILALSDEAGKFFFNGNMVFDNPRNFNIAGTIFKYRRPISVFSDGFEYIIGQGPTSEGLNVMYYNQNGKMPHITYEYTVPHYPDPNLEVPLAAAVLEAKEKVAPLMGTLMLSAPTPDLPATVSPSSNTTPSTRSSELSFTHNEIESSEHYKKHGNNQSIPIAPQILEPGDWELQTPLNLSSVPSLHLLFSSTLNELEKKQGLQRVPDSRLGMKFDRNGSSSPSDLHHTSQPELRSQFFNLLALPGSSLRKQCKDCSFLKFNSSNSLDNNLALEIFPGSMNLYEANTMENGEEPSYKLHPVEGVQASNTESNEFEVDSLDHDISLADMYRWKVSAYAPCSSTCTTGIRTSYALCVRYDGLEVDERYCDALTRPEHTQEFCSGKECQPRWETSRWSECSRTCGEGFQFRTVRCWKMLAPGLDSSVYDELCQSTELQKPMARKSCRSKACGPQWEVSEWSECTAACGGGGLHRRDVRCSMETRLCNESARPQSEKECFGPPCDHRWTVSDWGPCSGVCREGRMMRYVLCKDSNGNIIPDSQCDQDLKPLGVYPCGDRNCPAHWVEQEWEQCNATCGRGVKRRQVVCSGLENAVFKEFPDQACVLGLKPEETTPCFQRPCAKWFTTSWSQQDLW